MRKIEKGFSFKQFHIEHDRCAMKVGTDSIVLGAWVNVQNAERILDLGTGSGLLALMLAQRAPNALISGVELDSEAATQAQQNVERSPWAKRVQVFQQDIAEFAPAHQQQFDLIIANPPYFAQGVDCASPARKNARYIRQLSHLDWLKLAEQALHPQGNINFVLPFEAGEHLLQQSHLPCLRYCALHSKENKPAQRLLLSFGMEALECKKEKLVIHGEDNQYSAEFIQLTRDFYLKF